MGGEIALIALVFAAVLLAVSCIRQPDNGGSGSGTSGSDSGGGAPSVPGSIDFESIEFYEVGMMAIHDSFQALRTSAGVELTYYLTQAGKERNEWEVLRRIEGDQDLYDRIATLLWENRVDRWDGFSGSAKNVLDGTMFSFCAELSDGGSIRADGSNMFPKSYGAFTKAFTELFRYGRVEEVRFEGNGYSLELPESWVGNVTVDYGSGPSFVMMSDERRVHLFGIEHAGGRYYDDKENYTYRGLFAKDGDPGADGSFYLYLRESGGFSGNENALTPAQREILQARDADYQVILDSIQPAEGYEVILEG